MQAKVSYVHHDTKEVVYTHHPYSLHDIAQELHFHINAQGKRLLAEVTGNWVVRGTGDTVTLRDSGHYIQDIKEDHVVVEAFGLRLPLVLPNPVIKDTIKLGAAAEMAQHFRALNPVEKPEGGDNG